MNAKQGDDWRHSLLTSERPEHVFPPVHMIVDAHHVQIRAERSGNGNGRVYTITVVCTDGSNNTTKTVTVIVPKSQK